MVLHGGQGPGQVLDNGAGRWTCSSCPRHGSVVDLLDAGRLGLVEDAFDGLQGHTGLDQPTDPGEPGHVAQVVVAPTTTFTGNRKQPQRVVVAHRAHRRPGELCDLSNAHGDSLTRHLDHDPLRSAWWGRTMGSSNRLPGHAHVATVPA